MVFCSQEEGDSPFCNCAELVPLVPVGGAKEGRGTEFFTESLDISVRPKVPK